MFKAFIFDIGNVLLRFDFTIAIKRLEQYCDPITELLLHRLEPVKIAYESGQISRAEFQLQVRSSLQYTGTEADFVTAWQEIFIENLPMTNVVRSLHTRYPLYLLSNTSDLHLDYMLREYPFFGLFRDAVYSHLAKCVKPDRAIYEVAIRQFGIDPAKTVFIDDLERNIETARALGFIAIHYNFAEHEQFVHAMARLGVLV